MNCEQAHEFFSDYLGKELSREQANALAAHLKICTGCREELGSLSGVPSILKRGWPDEEIPKSLRLEGARSSWSQFVQSLIPREWPRTLAVGVVSFLCFMICVSALALWKTEIEMKQGHLKISFNAPVSVSPQQTVQDGTALPASKNREELESIIHNALLQSEQRQNLMVEQLLKDARAELNTQRSGDMQKISQALKYLELTQGEVWKASARNTSYLDALAREVYVKTSSTN